MRMLRGGVVGQGLQHSDMKYNIACLINMRTKRNWSSVLSVKKLVRYIRTCKLQPTSINVEVAKNYLMSRTFEKHGTIGDSPDKGFIIFPSADGDTSGRIQRDAEDGVGFRSRS